MLSITDYLFLLFALVSLYFLVFFLLLFFRNRRDLAPSPTEPTFLPSVSIIVPAYNEADNIVETVASLKALNYPTDKLEILVVDDGSTDGTGDLAEKTGVRVIRKENGGKASAINLGVLNSSGEIVGVVDADSCPDTDALINAVSFFSDPKVAAVTTKIMVKDKRNLLQRLQDIEYYFIAWQRKLLEYLDCVAVTPGPLSLYRRDVLMKIGGFDTSVITEDIEVAWRLLKEGYSIRMSLQSNVYTNAPEKLREWWRQRIRWYVGGIQTASKYRSCLFRRQYGLFGLFVVPQLLLYLGLTLLGFGLFLNLLYNDVYSFLLRFYYSYLLGTRFNFFNLLIIPNVLTVFFIIVSIASFFCFIVCIKSFKKEVGGLRGLLALIVYQTIYFLMFPPILLQAIWRLLVHKKQRW